MTFFFILLLTGNSVFAPATSGHNVRVNSPNSFSNMAEALRPHKQIYQRGFNFSLSKEEEESFMALYGDSFSTDLQNFRDIFSVNPDGTLKIILAPHLAGNVTQARVRNYSHGGATFTKFLLNHLHHWANNLPRLTILAVGACDIANTDLGDSSRLRRDFVRYVKQRLTEFVTRGRRAASDTAEFDRKIAVHHFLLIKVPQWGEPTTQREDSLTPEEIDTARNRANRGLQNNIPSLYKDHRAIVFAPRVNFPTHRGIHFSTECKALWLSQIMHMANKIVCSHCTLPSLVEFNKKEYELFKKEYMECARNKEKKQAASQVVSAANPPSE